MLKLCSAGAAAFLTVATSAYATELTPRPAQSCAGRFMELFYTSIPEVRVVFMQFYNPDHNANHVGMNYTVHLDPEAHGSPSTIPFRELFDGNAVTATSPGFGYAGYIWPVSVNAAQPYLPWGGKHFVPAFMKKRGNAVFMRVRDAAEAETVLGTLALKGKSFLLHPIESVDPERSAVAISLPANEGELLLELAIDYTASAEQLPLIDSGAELDRIIASGRGRAMANALKTLAKRHDIEFQRSPEIVARIDLGLDLIAPMRRAPVQGLPDVDSVDIYKELSTPDGIPGLGRRIGNAGRWRIAPLDDTSTRMQIIVDLDRIALTGALGPLSDAVQLSAQDPKSLCTPRVSSDAQGNWELRLDRRSDLPPGMYGYRRPAIDLVLALMRKHKLTFIPY